MNEKRKMEKISQCRREGGSEDGRAEQERWKDQMRERWKERVELGSV